MNQKITAVLITTEKEYPKIILDRLVGFDEIIIKTESPNVYTRYLEAARAKNEIIYVQDDDCFVNHQEIFNAYNGQLTNSMTPHHTNAYAGTGITLVGWGCYFPKRMLECFSRYIERYGEDFHLMREADRIFTFLNQPHNSLILPHQDLNQTARMSHDPEHYNYMRQALEKVRLL